MFSVVIPLYNKGPHIARALDSVLAQTVPPAEIIVVDDGSTDDGASIASRYASRGVQLLRQSNQGVSAARNSGVGRARSDCVAFLDADDWWLPDHLEQVRSLVHTHPEAALFSTAHVVQRPDGVFRPRGTLAEGSTGLVDEFFLAFSRNLSLVHSSTAVVRRTALLDVGGFPAGVRRGEDIIVWLKLAQRYRVAHRERVTAVFDQRAVARTDALRESQAPGSLQFMATLLRQGDLSAARRSGIRHLFHAIAFFTAAGFCMRGDRVGAFAIGKLALGAGLLGTATGIALLLVTPAKALSIVRTMRHRRVAASDVPPVATR